MAAKEIKLKATTILNRYVLAVIPPRSIFCEIEMALSDFKLDGPILIPESYPSRLPH